MARHAQITSTPVLLPCVLVVMDAVWPELFARCLVAATRCGVLVHRCELRAATTFAAERRPVAIVLSNAVHALDPEEFNALARDVHAALLRVDEEVSELELEAMFTGALRARERRDDDQRDDGQHDDGRSYALIRKTPAETPLPRSSQAPPPMRGGGTLSARSAPTPPRMSQEAPPPSSRSFAPPPSSRSFAPIPRGIEPPPSSARSVPPVSRPRESGLPPPARDSLGPPSTRTPRTLPPPQQPSQLPLADLGPLSVRTPPLRRTLPPPAPPLQTGVAPALSAPGDSPRSGMRSHGGDAMDAVFEEQPLPHETPRRGSAT